jgi:hypothetical protein
MADRIFLYGLRNIAKEMEIHEIRNSESAMQRLLGELSTAEAENNRVSGQFKRLMYGLAKRFRSASPLRAAPILTPKAISPLQGRQLSVSTDDIVRLICNDGSGLRRRGDIPVYIPE